MIVLITKYILSLRKEEKFWMEKTILKTLKREKKHWKMIICMCDKSENKTHNSKNEYDDLKCLSVKHIHMRPHTHLCNICQVLKQQSSLLFCKAM